MAPKSMLKVSVWTGVTSAALIAAGVAHAGVETMRYPRDPDRNCKAPHDAPSSLGSLGPIWTPAEGRLRFYGQGPEQFEFYGQLTDLGGAEMAPGSIGSARRMAGHAGPINAGRGCGNIGSIVVEVTLPLVSSETQGVLMIGTQRIPFTVVPFLLQSATWADENVDADPAPGVARPPSGGSPSSAPHNGPIISSGIPDCTGGQNCPNPGNGFVIVGGGTSSGSNLSSSNPIRTFTDCMDPFGVTAERSGNRLTVNLPRDRPPASIECFARSFVGYASFEARNVQAPMRYTSPQVAYTIVNASDGPVLTGRTDSSRHNFNLPRAEFAALVGEYRYTIAMSPAQTTSNLELVVKSDPAYGVERIGSAVARTSDVSGLTVTPYQAVKAGQRFSWRIASTTPGLVERCFSASGGVESPPAGATSFVLPPSLGSSGTCRAPFSVTVKPSILAGDPSHDTGLFGKTLTFTPAQNVNQVAPQQSRPMPTPLLPGGGIIVRPGAAQ